MASERLRYREVQEGEVAATVDLFIESYRDLAARKGIGPASPSREDYVRSYAHVMRTGHFEVAELGHRLVALCHATIRGRIWFLSGFWTLPELQGQGVGGPLLRRALDWGKAQGARTFFTWSSIDTRAMGLYMKLGMLPESQIFTFAGTPSEPPPHPGGYTAVPLDVDACAVIDERIRGARREIDHHFFLGAARGHQVEREGRAVAYFYEHDGVIGPGAWTDAPSGEALLSLSLRRATLSGKRVRIVAPGMNHVAIQFALRRGLRLVAYSHLLASGPFGQLERYLPSGPALF